MYTPCVASFVRITLLAAAPLSVWPAQIRATSYGVAWFSGVAVVCRRKTLLPIPGGERTTTLHAECDAPPSGFRRCGFFTFAAFPELPAMTTFPALF
jgi:hypothetical protein